MLCFQAPALPPCHGDPWLALNLSSPSVRELNALSLSPPHRSKLITLPPTAAQHTLHWRLAGKAEDTGAHV